MTIYQPSAFDGEFKLRGLRSLFDGDVWNPEEVRSLGDLEVVREMCQRRRAHILTKVTNSRTAHAFYSDVVFLARTDAVAFFAAMERLKGIAKDCRERADEARKKKDREAYKALVAAGEEWTSRALALQLVGTTVSCIATEYEQNANFAAARDVRYASEP